MTRLDYGSATLAGLPVHLLDHLHLMLQRVWSVTRRSTTTSHIFSGTSITAIDVNINRKPVCDFLLVINSN